MSTEALNERMSVRRPVSSCLLKNKRRGVISSLYKYKVKSVLSKENEQPTLDPRILISFKDKITRVV